MKQYVVTVTMEFYPEENWPQAILTEIYRGSYKKALKVYTSSGGAYFEDHPIKCATFRMGPAADWTRFCESKMRTVVTSS
jgi:hypothetical protein